MNRRNPKCCCGEEEVCSVEHDFEYIQLEPIDMRTLYVEGTATADYTERVERVRLVSDSSLVSETKLYESWNQNINFTQTSTTLYTDRFGGGMFFKNVVNTHVSDTIISTVYNPDGITYTETVDVLYSQARDELRLYGASTYDQGDYARMQLQYYRRRSTTDTSTSDPDTNDGFLPGSGTTNSNYFYPNDPVRRITSSGSTTLYAYADDMPDRHAGWVANNFTPTGYGTPTYQGIPVSGMGCAVPSSTYQFTTLSQWTTLFEDVVDQFLEVAGYTFYRRSLIFNSVDASKFDAQFVRGVAGDFYWDASGYTVKAPWTQANARYITIVSGPYLRENVAQTGYDYLGAGANGSYTTQPVVVFTNGNREGTQPTFSLGQTSRVDDLFTITKSTTTFGTGLTVDDITNLETSSNYDWGQSFKLELFDTKHSSMDDYNTYLVDASTSIYGPWIFRREATGVFGAPGDNFYAAVTTGTNYVQDWLEDVFGYFQSYPQIYKNDMVKATENPFECLEFYADAKRWNVKKKMSENLDALCYYQPGSNSAITNDHINIVEDGYFGIFDIYSNGGISSDSNAFQQFKVNIARSSPSGTYKSLWTLKKAIITTYNKRQTTCPDQSYLCSTSVGTVDTDDATYNSNHDYMPAGEQVSPYRDHAIEAYVRNNIYVHGGTDLTIAYYTENGCSCEWIQVRDPNATFPANHTHFAIRATFSGTLDNCDIQFKCWEADTSLAQVQTDTSLYHVTFTLAGIDFTDPSVDIRCLLEPELFIEGAYPAQLRTILTYRPFTNNFEIGSYSPARYISIDSGFVPSWFWGPNNNGIRIYLGSNN